MRAHSAAFAYSAAETVRENPVPAALVGLELGWLFIENFREESEGTVAYPLTEYTPQLAHRYASQYEPSGLYAGSRSAEFSWRRPQSELGMIERIGAHVSHAADGGQANRFGFAPKGALHVMCRV